MLDLMACVVECRRRFNNSALTAFRIEPLAAPGSTQHLDRHEDGCERVSELVGEHCQEFVFVAVRLAQGLLGSLALGDVFDRQDDPAVHCAGHAPGVEQHDAATDVLEVPLD
jgi:hypothetical protein